MLFITASDIKNLFTMREAIESDRQAFTVQAEGKTQIPVRTNFDVREGCVSSFMPGFVSAIPQVGIKVVSTFSENIKKNLPVVSATVLLVDPETGLVSALLDGTEITRLRTGAVSGLATELLAKENASLGALFGTGGQALSQLEALLTVRNLSEVRVYDKFENRIPDFIERAKPIAEKYHARLVAAKSSDDAIDNADIITTVTTTTDPVFNGERVKQGAHINGVGTFMPFKRELDETIIARADLIFIDNMDAIMSEAGDLLIPMSQGKFKKEDITGELGDLILGKVQGRTTSTEITIMKTVGFATLDIVIAYNIYKKAIAEGVGVTI
ncbi:MAG: ornithine cyclodeaminase family protein [bacterium]|nr:ornithine cyclodeaminase family protein [bacterium]